VCERGSKGSAGGVFTERAREGGGGGGKDNLLTNNERMLGVRIHHAGLTKVE
jgi:hypothetical protein